MKLECRVLIVKETPAVFEKFLLNRENGMRITVRSTIIAKGIVFGSTPKKYVILLRSPKEKAETVALHASQQQNIGQMILFSKKKFNARSPIDHIVNCRPH